MKLFFLGRAVETSGSCDDGWVWGKESDKNACWYWALQLDSTPWGKGSSS